MTPYKPRMLPVVRMLLEQRRGEWPSIRDATGVPYRTIQNIAQGAVENPRIESVEKLYLYLTAVDETVA